MRHVNYTLRPLTIDNAKPREKPYALADGGGLLLEILPSGTKTWRYKYHLNGKREKVTIGGYPAFTIRQARDRHEERRPIRRRVQPHRAGCGSEEGAAVPGGPRRGAGSRRDSVACGLSGAA
jgi:hypothetical protein